HLIKFLQQFSGCFLGSLGDSDALGQTNCLIFCKPLGGVHKYFKDGIRVFLGNLFDFYTAFGRGHDTYTLTFTIGHDSEIKLFLNVGAFFDEETADLLPLWACLVRDQLHAQDLISKLTHLIYGFSNLDPSSFASPTCMDLSFDYPHRTAEFVSSFDSLVNGENRNATGYIHTVFS